LKCAHENEQLASALLRLICRDPHSVIGGNGARLQVREWGQADAPAILFIHGWSQNHLCWRKQYDSQLADAFHLVAFDLRDHGMSEAPEAKEHYTDS
jgi:non-heme chloroperoxidase